jgi:hypothetical protein
MISMKCCRLVQILLHHESIGLVEQYIPLGRPYQEPPTCKTGHLSQPAFGTNLRWWDHTMNELVEKGVTFAGGTYRLDEMLQS